MENGNYLIWSYMRCFHHQKPDFGIDEYLERVVKKPDGFVALVYHPDFIHRHQGMDDEIVLPPHCCGYRRDYRRFSEERIAELSWTNHQIRDLARELHKRDMTFYISVMGAYYDDAFDTEWLSENPEALFERIDRQEQLCALRRLKDGTYYEDFFVEKLVRVLEDYEADGIHLCDAFAPLAEVLASGDYSWDMIDQFCAHTGIEIPEHIKALGEDNTAANKEARQKWIWYSHREAWIRFYDWRWTGFFTKVCNAVHKIGKKVSTLGMYISDPLRSMYTMGTDIRHWADAGVDFFTPNILPTSVYLNTREYDYGFTFHQFTTYIPAIKGMAPDACMYQMLGLRDEEEEWDVLRHEPNKFERDIFTSMGYHLVGPDGLTRCIDRPYVTIGDSIEKRDWELVSGYLDTIYASEPVEIVSPVIYWSDTSNHRMLTAHIATRRPSESMIQAMLQENGAYCGGVVRSENVACHKGSLLVPAFDLISDEEREELIKLKNPIFAMCPADYDISGLDATVCIEDRFSSYPLKAFLLNAPAPEDMQEIETLLACDDGVPNLPKDEDIRDESLNVMHRIFVQKITRGFQKACGMLMRHMDALNNPFAVSESPVMVLREEDKTYRVQVYSRYEDHYDCTAVNCRLPMAKVETISQFPYREVQFVDAIVSPNDTREMAKLTNNASGCSFLVKIRPGGLSAFRITLE